MPFVDQIHEIGEHSLKELNRLRAYYQNTKAVWRMAQRLIEEGRETNIPDPLSDRILESPELFDLAQGYVSGYLAESVFANTISLFEDFVFGLLNARLTARPLGIPNKDRQLTFRVVFDSPDRQTILQYIIDKELDEIKYQNLSR